MADINKAGAVIIRDRRLLVSRSKGNDIYGASGGKLEEGEDDLAALGPRAARRAECHD